MNRCTRRRYGEGIERVIARRTASRSDFDPCFRGGHPRPRRARLCAATEGIVDDIVSATNPRRVGPANDAGVLRAHGLKVDEHIGAFDRAGARAGDSEILRTGP